MAAVAHHIAEVEMEVGVLWAVADGSLKEAPDSSRGALSPQHGIGQIVVEVALGWVDLQAESVLLHRVGCAT